MNNLMQSTAFMGIAISLLAFLFGLWLHKKFPYPFVSPLLIAATLIILFLFIFKIDFESYNISASYLSYMITPATVAYAVPLYRNIQKLKKNFLAIMLSLIIGTLSGLTSIFLLAKLFNLSHIDYVSLLPKSITTAVGMEVSKDLGGLVSITVAAICFTGIFGAIIAEPLYRLIKVKSPISKGLGLGAASHVIGTSKATEIGDVAGAMGSVALVVSAFITIVGASIYSYFI